jgi:hypothetical protein
MPPMAMSRVRSTVQCLPVSGRGWGAVETTWTAVSLSASTTYTGVRACSGTSLRAANFRDCPATVRRTSL